MGWTIDDVADLSGRSAVVTGANSGLGLHTTIGLAAAGARVLMGARDPERGAQALETVRAELAEQGQQPATNRVELVRLDLGSLAAVREAAAAVTERVEALDILVNNAGIMATPLARTPDGFEQQIAVNHLAPFTLTGLLWSVLEQAERARVVGVSSVMHRRGRIDLNDLNFERRRYRPWEAYAQSKLANLLFALELNDRARLSGSTVTATTAHPGVADTNLFTGTRLSRTRVGKAGTAAFLRAFGHGAQQGAASLLHAATIPDLEPGAYIGPGGLTGARGAPARAKRASQAEDAAVAAQLWSLSEELTGVEYPPYPRESDDV